MSVCLFVMLGAIPGFNFIDPKKLKRISKLGLMGLRNTSQTRKPDHLSGVNLEHHWNPQP